MKKVRFISILGVLLCAGLLLSCEEEKPLQVQGTIEGTVVDTETGQAVQGVGVTIVANSLTTFSEQSKITGSDGKFSFKNLEAGSYKLSFAKEGYEDNSKNINLSPGQISSSDVALKSIKPALSVSTTQLDFGATINILPVDIRNTGKGELAWSVAEDLPWLSVSPITGRLTTGQESIIVSIDREQLTETSKSGSFVVNSNGGSAIIYVSASKLAPVLSVAPTSLAFETDQNALPLEITNTGTGELAWSILEDLDWLTVNPASGATAGEPAAVTITIDRSKITGNTTPATGTVTISSNGGNAAVNISVNLENPDFSVSVTSLDFGMETNYLTFELTNTGKGDLTWSIVEDLAWLSVNPASGTTTTAPSVATVTVDRSQLAESPKTATFLVNTNAGSATVNVSISKPTPVLSVSVPSLDFGIESTHLTFDVSNAGTGELSWSIVEDLAWLSVSPASGKTTTASSTVIVTVDRSLLVEDSRTATFVVTSDVGSATVGVSVSKPVPVLSVSVTSLDFGVETTNLPIEISNTGRGELTWSIVEDLAWLSVNPASGTATTAPSVATVTVDRSQLAESSKTATFLVNTNAGSATVSVSISKPTPVLSVTPEALDFGENETEKSINVSNSGAGTLTYAATASQSWITLDNAANSVATDTKIIKVTLSRAGLSPGDYSGDVVINSNSNSITVPVSMSVLQPAAPDLLNGQASGVTYNSAQVSGVLTSLGSSAVTQHGHCWSTSPDPTTADNKTTLGGTGVLKSFTSNITGLSANTTYYARAYATNAVGTTYAEAIAFATLPPPTVATVQSVRTENVRYNQIVGVGNLTVLGDGLVTDYGFCYSTGNATPTTDDTKQSLGQTTQTGEFTATLTGLQASTQYYLRAYAVNSMGTAYGTVIDATTADAPPVVTSGLVAYYTFDNENCNEAQEKSEYNGIKQGNGNPVWSTDIPGISGKALQVSDDVYYQIPTSPFIDYKSEWSVSIWVKMSGSSLLFGHFNNSTSSYQTTIGIGINSSFVYGLISGISSTNWYLMNSSIGSHKFDIDVSETLLNNSWHLLTVTRTSSGLYKLYVDAVLLSQFTSTRTIENPNHPMNIARYFTGKMDNFRIYRRAISQSEIAEIYNAKQ